METVRILLPAVVVAGLFAATVAAEPEAERSPDARLSPYSADPDHLWNRLHRGLFARELPDGSQHIHSTDPLLFEYGKYLLEGEPHDRAMALLDEFLAGPADPPIDDPLRRLFLQRDLWAAFDYAAWYPDDWVHYSRHEPAAIALRGRLATAIGRLALDSAQIDALPDNYALAVESRDYPPDYDPEHPHRPFLPADLFDPAGPWVRFHDTTAKPMVERHFHSAGGRAAHIVFLRLPDGRAATEQYLKGLNRDSVQQFPQETMVAMVRRALAVDQSAKARVTPVTELVQLRVYRRIPEDLRANFHGDFGEQAVCEFVLDRALFFAGAHALRPTGPADPAEPFERGDHDPFDRMPPTLPQAHAETQLKTCIQCHQAPGIHSILSMQRGLREQSGEAFRTYDWGVEMSYAPWAKVKQYNWGLLQGLLEAGRAGIAKDGGSQAPSRATPSP